MAGTNLLTCLREHQSINKKFLFQTSHHLDVPLCAIPASSTVIQPVPVIRLSLSTGHSQALVSLTGMQGHKCVGGVVAGVEVAATGTHLG